MSKRRRIEAAPREEEENALVEVFERPENLWLEDGSVILQAGSVQFKVHCSILSKHSSFFADLFKVPQPSDQPTLDGCPIVHIQDKAEDVKHVLLTLYGDREYANAKVPHFLVLAGMLRVGKKYEIDHLKDDALARLKAGFPTTLDEYCEIQDFGWTHFDFPTDEVYTTDCKKLCAVVRLAHECGLQTILPSLYMMFMTTDVDNLLALPLAKDHGIPYDALRSLIHARDKLIEARAQHVYGWIRKVGTLHCKSKHRCNKASQSLIGYIWDRPLNLGSVLYSWDAFKGDLVHDEAQALDRLCDPCLLYAQKAHRDGWKTIWERLPAYFRLPQWEDLRDEV